MTSAITMAGGRQGDGQTEIAVGEEKGRVLLLFHKQTNWIALDPANALGVAGEMARVGYKAKMRMPIGDVALSQIFGDLRKTVTAEQRNKLVNRVVVMMGSLKDRHPLYQAEQIVDTILSDAT